MASAAGSGRSGLLSRLLEVLAGSGALRDVGWRREGEVVRDVWGEGRKVGELAPESRADAEGTLEARDGRCEEMVPSDAEGATRAAERYVD